MSQPERVSRRPRGRAAFFIIPVLLLLGAALPLVVAARRAGHDSVHFSNAQVSQSSKLVRNAASDTIQDTRTTAIVRAARAVAPAVVSVNVMRTETVRPSSFFEQFFLGPGVSRQVQGLGSGFVIDARGLVLTNEHVVHGATDVVVTLSDGRDFKAEVVGTDEVTDLALLRLTSPPAGLAAAQLGTSSDLVIGEWVVAIGNPFGFLLSNPEPTVTAGVVSGVGRNIIPGDGTRGYYLDMIQTDASINPGNSGGPLVNALGQVVGVNSEIITETGNSVGLGFAIPIDRAKRVADDLLKEGRVRRVWVGLEVKEADPNSFGRAQRLQVSQVAAGSPAAQAGVRVGMVIDSAEGRPVHSALDWQARLLDARVGENIDLVVAQTGRGDRTLQISTQDLPSLTAARVRAGSDFEFITLTPDIQAEKHLSNAEGALIVGLSDAARDLQLEEGDLVLQINGTRIHNAQDAATILRRLSNSRGRSPVRMVFERDGQLNSVLFQIGG